MYEDAVGLGSGRVVSTKATESSCSNNREETIYDERLYFSKVAQINLDCFESASMEIALPIHACLGRAQCRCRTGLVRVLRRA
jgi:hypothetical protein